MNEKIENIQKKYHEGLFKAVLEKIHLAAVICDNEGQIIFINDYLLELTGWERSEVIGENWFGMFIPHDQFDKMFAKFEEIKLKDDSTAFYHTDFIRTKTGDQRLIGWNSIVKREQDGNFAFLTCIGADITEQHQTELALKEAKNRAEQLYKVVPSAVFTVDENKTITSINDKAIKMIGYTPEEIIGKSCRNFCVGPCTTNCKLLDPSIKKPNITREGAIYTKLGETLIVSKHIDLLKDEHGNVVGGIESFEDITELKRTERALRESEEQYRDLFENANDLIQCIDAQGKFLYVNQAWHETLGYTENDLSVLTFVDIIHPDCLKHCQSQFEEVINGGKAIGIEAKFITKSGKVIEVEGNASCRYVDGKPITTRGIFRDITKKKRAEEALRESEERYRTIFERTANPILIIDDNGNYIDCNDAACTFMECSKEELLKKSIIDFLPLGTKKIPDDHLAMWEDGGTIETEYNINGKMKILELTINPGTWQGNKVIFGMGKDITERRKAENKIKYLAYHDKLTDLPNRVKLQNRLNLALGHARRKSLQLALLFIDLDRFKTINDTLGHGIGDKLLQSVAKQLKLCVRKTDMVARLGGDEFIILLPKITEIAEAESVAKKVINQLDKPIKIDDWEFQVTPSIGIAIYPNDGESAATLLKNADAAMYRAKDIGRNNYQLYTSALNEKAMELLEMENMLRRALDNEEFILYYQPQVDIESGKIVGMEALVRWQNESLGLVPPMDFIPLAEECGLIIPIGEWVLKQACIDNMKLQQAGIEPIRVSVNLSGRQFQQPDLLEMVSRILEETGMDSDYLELEITETIAMKDMEYTSSVISKLKNMGVHIAIDDFGTGYASLSYLKSFPPIDKLKIDRSFIQDISTIKDEEDPALALVATMIVLAKNFKLKVIAEGVENIDQLNFLKRQMCNEIQGFLFSKPLSPEECTKFFLNNIRLHQNQLLNRL